MKPVFISSRCLWIPKRVAHFPECAFPTGIGGIRNEEVAYDFFIRGMGNAGLCDSHSENSRQRGNRQFAGTLFRYRNHQYLHKRCGLNGALR